MRIDDPLAIELEYVRRMMVWMLLRDAAGVDAARTPCSSASAPARSRASAASG